MKRRNSVLLADLEIGERLRRDVDHVARALAEAAHLRRAVAERAADLPGQLFRDLRRVGDDRLEQRTAQRRALGERYVAKLALCLVRGHQRRFDVRTARELALDVHAAVDGSDRDLRRHARSIAHAGQLTRCRAAGRPCEQGVDARVTRGSASSGGAWCGLLRASITSGPGQPQCLWRTNAPTPCTSFAGSLRVNVTHSEVVERARAKVAVIAHHDQAGTRRARRGASRGRAARSLRRRRRCRDRMTRAAHREHAGHAQRGRGEAVGPTQRAATRGRARAAPGRPRRSPACCPRSAPSRE